MRFDLYKCDWCRKEVKTRAGKTPSPVWPVRKGIHPEEIRDPDNNEKWVEPTTQSLIFCTSGCNQAHKEMEAEAKKAANDAWMTVYNRKKA